MIRSWNDTWKNTFRMHDGSQAPQNVALICLQEKGFDIGIYPPADDENDISNETEIGFWWANKDSHEFVAGTPLELLGLVSIWEHRGDTWKHNSDPDMRDELLEEIYGNE